MLNASDLAPVLNEYSIRPGPPKQIVVPHASMLAPLRQVAVGGTLLKKQAISIGGITGKRTVSLGANGGAYRIEADGDLHFCLGTQPLQPHITCEVQDARRWLGRFQAAVGQDIVAMGFFRCLFEHPGFASDDDAHIFEVHPVRAVTLGGQSLTFGVDLPDPASIHTWTSPHDLNAQDDRIRVGYDEGADTLTFTGMDGSDENYVRVGGTISSVASSDDGGATFTLTSPEISHPLQAHCLPNTHAAAQLAGLGAKDVTMVVLRGIDLTQALGDRYVIEALAIDIRPATALVPKKKSGGRKAVPKHKTRGRR